MATISRPFSAPERGVRASKAAPIIVATDGRTQSDSALLLGFVLVESRDALRVVTVVRTPPAISEAQLIGYADWDAARRAHARREALDQMKRLWNDPLDVEVHEGDPATMVARLAHKVGATMIVCGLGRHRVVDRMFGDETALRLIRVADVPVLAVAMGAAAAPRHIVVAIDFSETSFRAARMALDLAGPDATIHLAHVAPRDSSLYEWHGASTYNADAGAALQKVREQLRVPPHCIVQTVLLQGDPATELLAFATAVGADLIATGSHGRGFVTRMLTGSVATTVVRCATSSVLTVPHAAVMTHARTIAEPPEVVTLLHADWSAQLDEFSRRNVGRRGTLEVDDPDIGAQAQVFDYPLIGAAFDGHDERAELMFGESDNRRSHLTREIGSVTRIDVLRNDGGRDVALRIGHGAGQTILTFTSE